MCVSAVVVPVILFCVHTEGEEKQGGDGELVRVCVCCAVVPVILFCVHTEGEEKQGGDGELVRVCECVLLLFLLFYFVFAQRVRRSKAKMVRVCCAVVVPVILVCVLRGC